MVEITIAVHDAQWSQAVSDLHTRTKHCVDYVLFHQKERFDERMQGHDAEVAIVYTDSTEIQDLNKRFRGKDKPTNVLSFPADIDAVLPDGQAQVLGDLLLSYQVIEEEAEAQEKHFVHHMMHMLIHGLLHLLGYDHIYDEEAEIMEEIERQILAYYQIADPYEAVQHNGVG